MNCCIACAAELPTPRICAFLAFVAACAFAAAAVAAACAAAASPAAFWFAASCARAASASAKSPYKPVAAQGEPEGALNPEPPVGLLTIPVKKLRSDPSILPSLFVS